MKMKTVVVTGHKGFIGSHLVRTLEVLGVKSHGIDLKEGQNILNCRMPEADFCFHLAAQTDARCQDTQSDARINILGTLRVLDHYGEKTIFASSSAVNYPITPYAISKRAAEDYVRLAGGKVVRLCNIYGEGGHGVIDQFREQEILQIHGDGKQIRTFAPIEQAVIALIEVATQGPGALDILRGEDKTVADIAKTLDKPVRFLNIGAGIRDGRQICP
jgi:nucleoside-diphosphate-sugar epimerase